MVSSSFSVLSYIIQWGFPVFSSSEYLSQIYLLTITKFPKQPPKAIFPKLFIPGWAQILSWTPPPLPPPIKDSIDPEYEVHLIQSSALQEHSWKELQSSSLENGVLLPITLQWDCTRLDTTLSSCLQCALLNVVGIPTVRAKNLHGNFSEHQGPDRSEPSWDTCSHEEMRAWDWEFLGAWVPSWTEPNNDWRSYQNHLFNTLLHALDIFVYITNTSNSSTITKCINTIVFWLVKQFSSHSWWWKKDGKDTASYSK